MTFSSEIAGRVRALEEKASLCSRCGVCQSVCPVFSQTRLESDVARGRLHFISNLGSHLEKNPAEALAMLEKCVQCASCEASCPPDIPIMEIYREAREIALALIAEKGLPNAGPVAGAPQPALCVTSQSQPGKALEYAPIPGKPRVLIFPGCLTQSLYQDTLDACVAVLRSHGFGVHIPADLACCGKSCGDGGDASGLGDAVRKNLAALAPLEFDYLLSPCASCTATISMLWPRLARSLDDDAASRLEDICGRTMDISAFLVDVAGIEARETAPGATPVTYHDPCHLGKRLGKMWEPRTLLMANPDYEFIEMPEAGQCCGCGGRFSALHPDLSQKIGREKLDFAESTGARLVATSCSWCRWQLERLASGEDIQVCHPVNIYAAAIAQGDAQC